MNQLPLAAPPCACTHGHGHQEEAHRHGHDGCKGHDSCCGHQHGAAPEPVDLAQVGEVSATRAAYRIVNMDCPTEEALIRKKLGNMPGIAGLEFNLLQRVLVVNHDLPSTKPIEAALLAIDMQPEPLGRESGAGAALPETRIPWGRLALAGAFAAGAELAELLGESGLIHAGAETRLFTDILTAWLPMGLAVIAILVGGLTTYKKGWIALKNLDLNINALMSIAVTGAVLIGRFPEAAMVMVLFSLAEAIEAKSLERARRAIGELLSLTPETATVLQEDGTWVEMESRRVEVGSRVRVKPGERIALDGVIVQGQSTINQAPITGESMPVEKTVDDPVFAGTVNEAGSFEFKVTAGADDSTLARIIHAVKAAQANRAPIQRFVDRFARIYTPAVFVVALLVAIVPPLFLAGAWGEWIYTGLVILVIGCPCALVISTPVSIVSGMAAATRHGILIKGGLFLEQGRRLRCLALDKTGTLTHGKPRQTDFVTWSDMDGMEVIALAASLAARSDHPVSRAIAEAATARSTGLREVDDLAALAGRGVRGVIAGQLWHLGNHRLVEELGQCSPELETRLFALEEQGKSVVALVGEQGVAGLFAVADTLKPSSVTAIGDLRRLGVKTVMLTGDNEHTARVIADQVGVESFKANLLPQDKLAVVDELANRAKESGDGKVGMVGDGINDAPALARADVGFAMAAAGTDTAIETADVALMDDDLRKIPRFIRLSRATHAILLQNITLVLGVKAIFFGLTLAGQATMWMAVFADVGTSLLVVANGLRALRQ
ncbi:MAG: heavy metal translocating P-type ATPase [Desulfobulbus sp.]|jgi:Cd2+/Zn2+-exporting ATPase|uniref:heavy metal translocating P-type ATPase n=1 Tax=Desulfobulbus sp. TaxID=895 RepID=UPI00284FC83E|nr:heavy metal translocating P-type ATPase [Desulfobulbus sp.]MDR2549044.1 heavy metal translocating P-type ATPase [Desulfobulbus sp.]